MKTFISEGKSITVTADREVQSSESLLIGSMFGVAAGSALANQSFELCVQGIFEFKKDALLDFKCGSPVYFDPGQSSVVSLKKTDKSVPIGIVSQNSFKDSPTVRVRLNGVSV
jgi:predicted RecA/RadA family phage recombinase